MVDTLTPNIQLTNQTEGGNANTWGIKCDDNFEQIDDKFGDTTSIVTTGGTTTLTDEQELVAAVEVSGTLVANAVIEFSGRGGFWVVANTTTGDFTVTVKVTGETGIQITRDTATLVWCDGDDIRTGVPSGDVVADTTPQLGGDLDANGFDIQFDDATGIRDDSDNEQLIFQKTASAVNHVEITNAATGNAPQVAAAGDNTNIDLALAGKGTGGVVASFKQATGLGLKDSDSSHDLKLKTSSNLAADRTLDIIPGDADRSITLGGNLTVSGNATLPAGTALVAANNLSDVGNAATAFAAIKQAASDGASGVVEIADQSEMEAASDTGRAVVPGRQRFHPGHPKAGENFDGTGTPAFRAGDYGMGAITDNGTGNYTLALDTAFADTNYWFTNAANGGLRPVSIAYLTGGTKTASSIQVQATFGDDTDRPYDPTDGYISFWGDYA